jgi:allantoin racemase
MKIRVINPTISKNLKDIEHSPYHAFASPDTEVSVVCLRHGPASIESDYDVAVAVPDILRHVIQAEKEGMDAVIIDCMCDPGLYAARELVSIPVVGPSQSSMSLAAMLADRFSVIGILERDRQIFHNIWRLYDLQARGASVRIINMPVLELHDDEEKLIKVMIMESALAVSEDHAHALVLGCTGMGGLADPVQQGLAEKGYAGVPVIDPTGVALKLAESLVSLKLCHSKMTFPDTPKKKVLGYDSHKIS